MKQLLQNLVRRSVSNDAVWRVLDSTVLRPPRLFDDERRRVVTERRGENARVAQAIELVIPDLVVRHGPFAGMRYPTADSVYSALFPKLLGSYERELAPAVERMCANPYARIVDIGCAEGYYAIGLALRVPTATVYAFDTDPKARALCESMAALNGVHDRVEVGGLCTPESLSELCTGTRALVVADCEGFESTLFTPHAVAALRSSDVVVEAHDFLDISISDGLRAAFEATHDITVVTSTDDLVRARTYRYPELASFDLATRRLLVAERRPTIMEWLVMSPRPSA